MEPATERSFEIVIKQKMDRRHQIVFHNFPELSEWRTKDLFEENPTKPNLWRYVGRLDDLLVFSNGEKMNPVAFEKTIEGHPWVQGALVVGSGQFQAGLIIEPHADRKAADDETLYGESKHVASSILFRAASKSGLRATVLLLGQLGGPVDGTGAWNKAGK